MSKQSSSTGHKPLLSNLMKQQTSVWRRIQTWGRVVNKRQVRRTKCFGYCCLLSMHPQGIFAPNNGRVWITSEMLTGNVAHLHGCHTAWKVSAVSSNHSHLSSPLSPQHPSSRPLDPSASPGLTVPEARTIMTVKSHQANGAWPAATFFPDTDRVLLTRLCRQYLLEVIKAVIIVSLHIIESRLNCFFWGGSRNKHHQEREWWNGVSYSNWKSFDRLFFF